MAKSNADNQSVVSISMDSELQAQIDLLTSENEALRAQVEALESALIEKDAALTEARTIKETSSVKFEAHKEITRSVPTETFTVEGKTYRFKKAGFIISGERFKAVDALKNDALLVTLIDYPSVVELVE